ncbi:hypothetical protein [Thiorhodococcus mannitoliphagus]|uniref:hypothetical protein n=1 Tax=Thiorhodococcus mannitoliphagus TaxID=329406 RepID=UPI0013E00BF5|nr:hypothetical protein [Thiorhodococcus mannitoliphagus]
MLQTLDLPAELIVLVSGKWAHGRLDGDDSVWGSRKDGYAIGAVATFSRNELKIAAREDQDRSSGRELDEPQKCEQTEPGAEHRDKKAQWQAPPSQYSTSEQGHVNLLGRS